MKRSSCLSDDRMGSRVIIDSGTLEDKIWSAYEKRELLDELHQRLVRIQECDPNTKPELAEMIKEVEQMCRINEEIHSLLESFMRSVESTMRRNEKELGELQDVVRHIFFE